MKPIEAVSLIENRPAQEKLGKLFMQTQYQDEFEAAFDKSKERLRLQNHRDDLYR